MAGFVAAGSSVLAQNTTAAATSGYLQIDDLTVTGVFPSSTTPAQIFAADLSYPTMANGTAMATTTAAVTCQQFVTDSSPVGIPVTCPVPLIAPVTTTTTATSSSVYYSPYTLEIDAATQLLLAGRAPAVLGNITPGDIVNVYGYFDAANGTMNAEIVRDLSKPAGPLTITSSSSTSTSSSTAIAVATSSAAIAQLQAYIGQLASVVAELQVEIATGTLTASSTASAPMIPATAY